jgi:glycosyltransferase involved in cell wall biosynthesis
MPVYNGEKYIREALDSLLAQTFTDFELIVSDNASTDETPVICQEYAARDPRIRYVRQSENRGAMANFQFVLDEAGGEYFMWAAADDRWDVGWLAALVKRLDPGVSIAFGSVVEFQDDDPKGRRTTLRPLRGRRTLRMLRCYLWPEWGTKYIVFYGLYRTTELRKVATEVIGQTADFRFGLDNILVFTMLQIGGLSIEPSVTFYKRWKPGVIGARPTPRTRLLALRQFGRYFVEHVRRSPPGATRCAVLAATPIKYGWLVCRRLRRAVALF